MARFLLAYASTNKREGMVLSNVPSDRGGMTFGGISRVHHPDWAGWVLIDSGDRQSERLLDLHRAFFKAEFWDRLRLDDVDDQEVAEKIYDAAVNCGPGMATRWAQIALGVANNQGRLWPDVVIDSRLGPVTVGVLNRMSKVARGRWLWLQVFESHQEMHYVRLAIEDPSQEVNLFGWYSHRILHRKEA